MHIYQVLENGVPRFRGTKKQCEEWVSHCCKGNYFIKFYKIIY